jgi:hypothetical protein
VLNTHTLVAFLHVVLFAYWLGSDLGVFICGMVGRRPGVSPEGRANLQEAGTLIDMAPRTCLVLMVPAGLTLAADFGLSLSGPALGAIWIGSLAWLWLVWQVHWQHGSPLGRAYWRIDFVVRFLVMAGFVGFGAASLAGLTAITGGWLAAKMLAFGLIILCGIIVRILLLRVAAAATPAEAGMPPRADVGSRIRQVVLVIWALVALAAFLGVTKPF